MTTPSPPPTDHPPSAAAAAAAAAARYPEARAINRRIVFHMGPTNSGKTYHALQRFVGARSGVYCGPLKLLAAEVFEKCNRQVSDPRRADGEGSAPNSEGVWYFAPGFVGHGMSPASLLCNACWVVMRRPYTLLVLA